MPQDLDKSVLEDEVAVSMARAVAVANRRARQEGVQIESSLVSATEQGGPMEVCWRITYGPRDYIRSRGGDLIIDVGISDGSIKRVLQGQ
jgi:hypothetical protein